MDTPNGIPDTVTTGSCRQDQHGTAQSSLDVHLGVFRGTGLSPTFNRNPGHVARRVDENSSTMLLEHEAAAGQGFLVLHLPDCRCITEP